MELHTDQQIADYLSAYYNKRSVPPKAGEKCIDKSRPCVYAWSNAKRTSYDLSAPCHASMHRQPRDTWDIFYTSFPAGLYGNEFVDLEFFEMMRNTLYATYKDYISMVPSSDGQHGVIKITDLDKIPANVVYNIAICSRIIVEHHSVRDTWWALKEGGVHESLAVILACFFFDIEPKSLVETKSKMSVLDVRPMSCQITRGHFPFDNTLAIDRIINGTPENHVKSYKESPSLCYPCNVSWGIDSSTRDWNGMTVREIQDRHVPIEKRSKKEIAA